jgi:hypothetical protein
MGLADLESWFAGFAPQETMKCRAAKINLAVSWCRYCDRTRAYRSSGLRMTYRSSS